MRPIAMLPNILTTLNIVCGVWAMTLCLEGGAANLAMACKLIILSAVFDGLDGRVARWAKVSSKFGVELDSLADCVSFGAAPAMLLYAYALRDLGPFGRLAAIAFTVCGALRLARFNVGAGEGQSAYYFQGSPIPAAAGLMVSAVLYSQARETPLTPEFLAGLMAYSSVMMVSSFPFPAAKKTPSSRSGRMLQALVPACILMGMLVYRQSFLFTFGLAYMASGPLWSSYRALGGLVRRGISRSTRTAGP
jgi:CDP-diacylglycerol--serine O-phosphatidyltransferase